MPRTTCHLDCCPTTNTQHAAALPCHLATWSQVANIYQRLVPFAFLLFQSVALRPAVEPSPLSVWYLRSASVCDLVSLAFYEVRKDAACKAACRECVVTCVLCEEDNARGKG